MEVPQVPIIDGAKLTIAAGIETCTRCKEAPSEYYLHYLSPSNGMQILALCWRCLRLYYRIDNRR